MQTPLTSPGSFAWLLFRRCGPLASTGRVASRWPASKAYNPLTITPRNLGGHHSFPVPLEGSLGGHHSFPAPLDYRIPTGRRLARGDHVAVAVLAVEEPPGPAVAVRLGVVKVHAVTVAQVRPGLQQQPAGTAAGLVPAAITAVLGQFLQPARRARHTRHPLYPIWCRHNIPASFTSSASPDAP